jgi:hypothetical protein
MNNLSSTSIRAWVRRKRSAFTLAECILSIGITSTALLGVVGMLAGTLDGARDARVETLSGMMVRQLAGEMRELVADEGAINQQTEVTVLLDQAMQVLGHSRQGGAVESWYQSGAAAIEASAFARLVWQADPTDPLMNHVVIQVETPASLPAGLRKVVRYAALSPK